METNFNRLNAAAIGFNRVLEALASQGGGNYPPFNVSKPSEDQYKITIAAAGFKESEIEITHHSDRLVISAEKQQKSTEVYQYQGISFKPFRKTFALTDEIKPVGASYQDGLLTVDLRVITPDEKKPTKININSKNH